MGNIAKYFVIVLVGLIICVFLCISILKKDSDKNQDIPTSNISISKSDNSSKIDTNSKVINDTSQVDDTSKIDDTSSNYNFYNQGYGYVYQSEKVDKSYFDNVLFIGDSVTNMLKLNNDTYGLLGNAKFFASTGLGYGNSLWDLDYKYSVFPTYRGDTMLIEDAVVEIGLPKVYIMFGMNDIGVFGIDKSIENMKKLTERILEKSPDVQIYIQSVTPIIEGKERDDLNNEFIKEFNKRLCACCEELGFYFINVYEALSDKNGYMIKDYCGDIDYMGMHPSNDGCKAWIEYLLTHTVN